MLFALVYMSIEDMIQNEINQVCNNKDRLASLMGCGGNNIYRMEFPKS